MRFTKDLGCRYRGIPHDLTILGETPQVKYERCSICNKTMRFNKGYKGRVKNTAYLKAHVRNFAQRSGATRRIYYKVYHPDKTTIYL